MLGFFVCLILISVSRWEDQGPESWNNLLEVPQLASGRPRRRGEWRWGTLCKPGVEHTSPRAPFPAFTGRALFSFVLYIDTWSLCLGFLESQSFVAKEEFENSMSAEEIWPLQPPALLLLGPSPQWCFCLKCPLLSSAADQNASKAFSKSRGRMSCTFLLVPPVEGPSLCPSGTHALSQ